MMELELEEFSQLKFDLETIEGICLLANEFSTIEKYEEFLLIFKEKPFLTRLGLRGIQLTQ